MGQRVLYEICFCSSQLFDGDVVGVEVPVDYIANMPSLMVTRYVIVCILPFVKRAGHWFPLHSLLNTYSRTHEV